MQNECGNRHACPPDALSHLPLWPWAQPHRCPAQSPSPRKAASARTLPVPSLSSQQRERERLPVLDSNQRDGPQSWAFRLASPEPDILGPSLGASLQHRSRPGGLPSLTSSRTVLPLLLMFYSGQSQLRHFNRNSTIHAQQKNQVTEREELTW